MKTKVFLTYMLIISFILMSCGNQPNISPTAIANTTHVSVLTSTPTKLSSSQELSTSTTIITPTAKVEIFKNAEITFSAGIKGIFELSPNSDTVTPVIATEGGNILFLAPSWSPDGTKLVFEKDAQVYLMVRISKSLKKLRSKQGEVQSSPAWSPDGDHIAYVANNALVITNVDGKASQQFTTPSINAYLPAWSPDARQLAFLDGSNGIHQPFSIYTIDATGNNLRSLAKNVAGESQLAWSPDGQKIAFRSFEGCGDINVLDINTGARTNLTNTPNIPEQDPAWSPDGQFIVFARASYAPCEQDKVYSYYGGDLFIMRANGQDVTQLAPAQNGLQPSWWPTVVLQSNWKYSVTKPGSNLNVRESGTTSANSLTKLKQGAVFTALDGPVDAENYQWWKIRTEDNVEGWIVDVPGWYMFKSAP